MFDLNSILGTTEVATTKNTPAATVEAGGWWESANSGLSDALDIWGKVEVIKGVKSANGRDQQQAMYQPELQNGAAIQVEQSLDTKTKSTGIKIDKPLMIVSIGVLAMAFFLRRKGWA